MAQSNIRTVIVAGVEPSSASDHVVQTAAEMARIIPAAELHFVHIVDIGPAPHNTSIPIDVLIAEARTYLEGVTAAASRITSAPASGHIGLGAPAKRILQIAADLEADLVIVGTHEKRGLAGLLGSTSRRVVQSANCPVLLARTKRADDAPVVEPPCPDCLGVQRRSNGETLWCANHAARHVHGRLHYAQPMIGSDFGRGSMLIDER